VANLHPNPGSCDVSGACVYPPTTMNCGNPGCWSGACNSVGPSFVGDATGTSTGGTVTFDKEANLNPSTGSAPANVNVAVTIQTQPNGSLQQLQLGWTNNDFASATNFVTMTLASQSGGVDTWTGSIFWQTPGTTVRFYFDGLEWDSTTHIYNPGGFVNYTYVNQ
jgi:hypothetical protein